MPTERKELSVARFAIILNIPNNQTKYFGNKPSWTKEFTIVMRSSPMTTLMIASAIPLLTLFRSPYSLTRIQWLLFYIEFGVELLCSKIYTAIWCIFFKTLAISVNLISKLEIIIPSPASLTVNIIGSP